VDGTAIRKRIKKDYEKAVRDLENSRSQLDEFHKTDLPQFTRWLNTHFGVLLTEARELSQKMAADEELIFEVENEVMFSGVSYARAYKLVMELREHPEPVPPPPTGSDEPDKDRDPFGTRSESEDFDEEDLFDEFFEQLFEGSGPDEDPRERRSSRAGQRAASASQPHNASRLKEIYRSLVRRLHPDTQREMTAQKSEWWHQAQEAYEAGDLEQLEVILTLCEIGESGTTAHTSASLLQRITAKLKSSVREIKRQIAERRKDPAWNFSRRSDHAVMAGEMRRNLMDDLRRMREHWRESQEVIAAWKAAAERLKPPRRRKQHRQNMEFPF